MLQIPSPIKTCLKLFSVFGAQINLQMVKPLVVGFIGLQVYRLVRALIVIKPVTLGFIFNQTGEYLGVGVFLFEMATSWIFLEFLFK